MSPLTRAGGVPWLAAAACWLAGCTPPPAPQNPTGGAPTTASATTTATAPAPTTTTTPAGTSSGLRTLLLLKPFSRMVDCGHDDTVGPLHCSFKADGAAYPVKDEHALRVFVTDPPGLVLAAANWHPARKLGDADAVAAECEFEQRGRLDKPHLAAATVGVPGWLYDGTVDVGVVSACVFAAHGGPPKRLSANHVLVAHDKAIRKPPKITRTAAEALVRARAAAARLEGGAVFEEVANSMSDDVTPGGSLGQFSTRTMAPEFSLVLLSTAYGARSPVFETSFGFHVLRRNEATASEAK